MPFASGPVLAYIGLGKYRTVGPTVYVGAQEVITIPSEFVTDLASVPRIFWPVMPPNGAYEKAAVVHDWHCGQLRAGNCDVSSRDADGLFRRIAHESGTGWLVRWLLWAGVRWSSLTEPSRRPGWLRDAPLVTAITALAAAALAVAVCGFDRLAHLIF